MIIQCEKCGKKFDLDESLIKNEGSKVRCSMCKHVFMAHPPEPVFLEELELVAAGPDELDKTLVQESPPFLEEEVTEIDLEEQDIDFEDVFDELPETEEIESDADAAIKRRRKPRTMLFSLIILLLLIILGFAILRWGPDLIPSGLSFLKPAQKKAAVDPGTRRLSFKGVDGDFVDSEKSGKLYVVRGMVINNYPKSRSFIRIKGAILDDNGRAAKTKIVYAGNIFKDKELRALSIKEIDRAMKNRYGMNKNNINVAPGANIPFIIVFEALPDKLSEFEVMAVSSSPGD